MHTLKNITLKREQNPFIKAVEEDVCVCMYIKVNYFCGQSSKQTRRKKRPKSSSAQKKGN